jgi:nucleotide-binding universal stress UspA family protein
LKTKTIEIKNILYTTDLSDTALHAFSYAASLAELYNASITILHVIGDKAFKEIEPRLVHSGMLTQDQFDELERRHINEVRETLTGKSRANVFLQDALTRFAENVQAEGSQSFKTDKTIVLLGDPVEKIIETANAHNCDLIVMGAHGHGFLQDLIGSTTRKVLRKSQIPVLVIRLDK